LFFDRFTSAVANPMLSEVVTAYGPNVSGEDLAASCGRTVFGANRFWLGCEGGRSRLRSAATMTCRWTIGAASGRDEFSLGRDPITCSAGGLETDTSCDVSGRAGSGEMSGDWTTFDLVIGLSSVTFGALSLPTSSVKPRSSPMTAAMPNIKNQVFVLLDLLLKRGRTSVSITLLSLGL